MNRVLVSVEGQTEETFVRDMLRPHLWVRNVDLQPVIVSTKRVKQGNKFKGGLLSYAQARGEIQRLLKDRQAVAITTMYDLYHLPTDFPKYGARPAGSGLTKARHLERALSQSIGASHFRPYLQVHEFEALLFVDPVRTAAWFPEHDYSRELLQIRQKFPTPEDINDNPNTAPSKRLLSLYPNYSKPI